MSASSETPLGVRQLLVRSMRHGTQWRYLVVFPVVMLVPVGLSMAPVSGFLGGLFDHSPRTDLVARLDSSAFTEVMRQMREPDAATIYAGTHAAMVVALILAPLLAGAAAAMARHHKAHLQLGALLGGAGGMYAKMLRMALVAVLPLGLAGAGAGLAFHLAGKSGEHATLETSADGATHWATAVSVLLVWLAHVTVESGRAHLAAQPERKSAFLAWWSGVRLAIRRPAKVFAVCSLTSVLGVGGALLVTALRFRITEGGVATIALGFLLGQVAVMAIAWGRSSRLVGLVEIIRGETKLGAPSP